MFSLVIEQQMNMETPMHDEVKFHPLWNLILMKQGLTQNLPISERRYLLNNETKNYQLRSMSSNVAQLRNKERPSQNYSHACRHHQSWGNPAAEESKEIKPTWHDDGHSAGLSQRGIDRVPNEQEESFTRKGDIQKNQFVL